MDIKTFGTGIFVKDPVLVNVGKTVKASFTLVYNDTYRKKTGEVISTPHYLDFEAWDTAARHIVENCRKGDKIFVEAKPKQERWEKDGTKRQRIIFRIEKFDIFKYDEADDSYDDSFNEEEEYHANKCF